MSPRRLSLLPTATLLALSVAGARPAAAAGPTTADCLTANENAIKARAEHQLRAAREQSVVCAAPTCPKMVRDACQARADDLTRAIPTVVFEVKDAGGNELSAVTVAMDGVVVVNRLDGSALTLDPGAHRFTFTAPGEGPVTQTIILHDGDRNRHVAVSLAPPSGTPQPAPPGHAQRVAGVVTTGVGVVGVVVGGVFGGLGFAAWSSANSLCPTHNDCSSTAASDRSRTVTYATVSDVGFIGGGLLLAAGLTLYLTAPKSASPTAALQVTPGGLTLAGRF